MFGRTRKIRPVCKDRLILEFLESRVLLSSTPSLPEISGAEVGSAEIAAAAAAPGGYNASDWAIITAAGINGFTQTWTRINGELRLTTISMRDKNLQGDLDLSGLTALHTLWLDRSIQFIGNQLTSLDVSGCVALRTIYCSYNQLTSLNIDGCTALQILYCTNNKLTSLDVSGCTDLRGLSCDNNQLTSLDVSNCTALRSLQCSHNQLTSLDVSGCTALQTFTCSNNRQLTFLNVSGRQLTTLNLSGCTALEWLVCNDNQLTTLDVSGFALSSEMGHPDFHPYNILWSSRC